MKCNFPYVLVIALITIIVLLPCAAAKGGGSGSYSSGGNRGFYYGGDSVDIDEDEGDDEEEEEDIVMEVLWFAWDYGDLCELLFYFFLGLGMLFAAIMKIEKRNRMLHRKELEEEMDEDNDWLV